MPKLSIRTERRRTSGASPVDYTLVSLDGFIDAPNFQRFDLKLDELAQAGENLVLDFRRVQYINSTGISTIIRLQGILGAANRALVLTQVPRTVGLTMHLLGVTSLVPFMKNLPDAERVLDERAAGRHAPADPGSAAWGEADPEGAREIPVLVEAPAPAHGSVVVAVPRQGPFTEILRRRLGPLNGRYHLCHSTQDILRHLNDWDPDLIVLDHRLDGADGFIETLKVETPLSLTSVLVLYERATDVSRREGFRVWENDYLIDPFDLMNLFRLTESELRRVPRDKQLFSQQVHFAFDSSRPSVERGLQLGNELIQKLTGSDTDRTALYAAFKEAVDNAVTHGNRHRREKSVDVNFLVDPHKVTFIVEDAGEGFDYEYYLSRIDDDEALEKAKQRIRAGGRGGLGILLMHKCTDRLEYSGTGNVVRIEKNLSR